MIQRRDRKSTRLNSSHTVIYTLSLHDALPILLAKLSEKALATPELSRLAAQVTLFSAGGEGHDPKARSEEHTSELQSHSDLHSFPTRRSSDLACQTLGEGPRHARTEPTRRPGYLVQRRRRRP